jgi:hypothetical protein
MSSPGPSSFLRRALVADAAISGSTGVLLILGAGPLSGALGIPAPLLRYAGLSLVPFVALVASLAARATLPRGGVWTVIALNAAWVLASALLLFSGRVAPTALGSAFVVAQALAVGFFAELQYVGLRRSAASA